MGDVKCPLLEQILGGLERPAKKAEYSGHCTLGLKGARVSERNSSALVVS